MRSETSFSLPLNRHEHWTIDVPGIDLTGGQELNRLEPEYEIGSGLRRMLLRPEYATYDTEHRLVPGERYRVAIVQKEVHPPKPHKRVHCAGNIGLEHREFGASFGYRPLLAGAAFRLREALSDQQLAAMGLPYIVVVHDPIHWTFGTSEYLFLHVVHRYGKPLIGAGMVRSLSEIATGALAYLDPCDS